MAPFPIPILHGAAGAEVTLFGYLVRLLGHLLAFGVVAGLVYLGSSLIAAFRSAVGAGPEDEPTRQ